MKKCNKLLADVRFQRMFMLAVAALCLCPDMLAAGGEAATGAFNSAAKTIESYQEPVEAVMKAIACVIAIVGAFNVYFKMQNGDQDVKKTIMLTIGGCIAFVALAQALPLFFS